MKDNKELDTYAERGVSSQKEGVHKATASLDKGIVPNSFCKVMPDIFAGDSAYGVISHADGTGTKIIGNLLHYLETGHAKVLRWSAQDAIVMNLDDIFAAGLPERIAFTQSINRNSKVVSDEAIAEFVEGSKDFFDLMKKYCIEIHYAGGETADLGDSVRTITLDATMTCRMKLKNAIPIDIKPGDIIVGLASSGQAVYEDEYNSGIGSNGLTDARNDLLSDYYYRIYPEFYNRSTTPALMYRGKHRLDDLYTCLDYKNRTIAQLLLSPTRTYAPILKDVHEMLDPREIAGIIHCSGGGQTKVLKFTDPEKVSIVKDNLMTPPDIFDLIQTDSQKPMQKMYEVYNMGHRMELYLRNEDAANQVIGIAKRFGVEAKIIGRAIEPNGYRLKIKTESLELKY
jgi:phosphoribosylformylglycinamidine cyclo-ligase